MHGWIEDDQKVCFNEPRPLGTFFPPRDTLQPDFTTAEGPNDHHYHCIWTPSAAWSVCDHELGSITARKAR